MGKREWLIGLGFAMAAVLAYWLTATPAVKPAPAHSLPALVGEWRDASARSAARETVQTIGSKPLGPHVSDLRVSGFSELHVVGDARQDLAWELGATASGPTPEDARALARSISIRLDDLGSSVAIGPAVPDEGGVSTSLTLRVPARMAVRLEGARTVDVSGVRHLRLDGIVGDARVSKTLAITGAHRNGALTIDDAETVDMGLAGSRATFSNIRGELRLTTRSGECRVTAPGGPVSIDATNSMVAIHDSRGDVRVNATGGSVAVQRPNAALHIDGRRAAIEIILTVPTEATLVAANGTVDVRVHDDVPITIDAVAKNGAITTPGRSLGVTRAGTESRLHHAFGSRARVSIRTTDGPIVIAEHK